MTTRQAAALLTLCLALPLATAPEARAGDWPGFRGSNRDGRSTESLPKGAWPKEGLPLLWQHAMGEGYSAPVVARGKVFVFDRHGSRNRLVALDAATGQALWKSEYPTDYEDYYDFSNGPRAAPLVDGDRVYTFGAEGRLRCLRVRDGTLVWEVDTTERFGVVQNFFGVGSAPIVEGDLLIAMVGGSPAPKPGESPPRIHSGTVQPNGSALVAFDKRTGKVRYTSGDELASYSSPVIAQVGGQRRGYAFLRGGLIGFEPATGKIDFRFPWRAKKLETVNASTPVVVDDTVFLTESYGPGGVLLEMGEKQQPRVLWQDPPRRGQSLASHWSTPVFHRGYLYGSSGQNSGNATLRAVHHATGKVAWSHSGLRRSTLLWVDGHLVVLGEYGELLLVRATPDSYQPVADLLPKSRGDLLRFPAWSPPALANGVLYVRGKDRLLALALSPVGSTMKGEAAAPKPAH